MTDERYDESIVESDRNATLRSRENLEGHSNLLLWYETLYRRQMAFFGEGQGRILEIGSGSSPLKRFYPDILTSDVLDLDYLDYVFDCHRLGEFDPIPDGSLRGITLTNVLHHLKNPLLFLEEAAKKLQPGGKVVATEPLITLLSYPILQFLHPEPVDLSIKEPKLENVEGPLSSSNQGMPTLMFYRNREWLDPLRGIYNLDKMQVESYTGLSYFATGGIGKKIPIPKGLYKFLFHIDAATCSLLPRLWASFFTVCLTRK